MTDDRRCVGPVGRWYATSSRPRGDRPGRPAGPPRRRAAASAGEACQEVPNSQVAGFDTQYMGMTER